MELTRGWTGRWPWMVTLGCLAALGCGSDGSVLASRGFAWMVDGWAVLVRLTLPRSF